MERRNLETSIEQVITGFFVKYNRLNEIIPIAFKNSNSNKLNIFIDLYSVVKSLYSIDMKYTYSGRYELSAAILNMCAHYRGYFNQMNVATNFHIIYSTNLNSFMKNSIPEYNSSFFQKYILKADITKMIEENMQALNLLSLYLPGIYFYNVKDFEVSSMIYHIMNYTKSAENGIESIIITKDLLQFQLIPIFNIKILRPSKTKDGDESYIVDMNNLWNMFFIEYRNVKPPIEIINPGFISNILCMTRIPERSLKPIFNIPQAYKIIKKSIDFKFLDNNIMYHQSVINTALEAQGIKINPDLLVLRYKSINPQFVSQYGLLYYNPEFRYLNFIDLSDRQSLHSVLNQYYWKTPIDLDRLQ